MHVIFHFEKKKRFKCCVFPRASSLSQAIDGADTGEGPAGVMLPVLSGGGEAVDATLFNGTKVG